MLSKDASLKDLIVLKDNRKWYHFCESIPFVINQNNAEEILNLLLENILQYHPSTLTNITLFMTKYFDSEKSLDFISKSIKSIEDSQMYSGDFKMEIVHLQIQKCIILVKSNKMEDIESKIFEYKKVEMNSEVYCLYNYLAFIYYEKTNNYEYSVKFLLEYVKKGKTYKIEDLETLARYSLISKNFFNFIEISTLKNFGKINEDLFKIYNAVQEGNTKLIDSLLNPLEVIFSNKSQIVREKAYYIGLINLCFKETNGNISFNKIQEELKISDLEINGFLLKSFGLGLIKGWINDKEKILYFNTIIPRCLSQDELIKMKGKFTEWKNRIKQAIEMIE